MNGANRIFRIEAGMLAVAVAGITIGAPALLAQSRREEFLNVTGWRGSFNMRVDRSGQDNGVKWRFQGTAKGEVRHDTPALAETPPRWLGKIVSSEVNIRADLSYATGAGGQCSVTGVFVATGPLNPSRNSTETYVRVMLNVWDFRLSRTIIAATYTKTTVCPSGTSTQVSNTSSMIPGFSDNQFPYPPSGFVLDGSGKSGAATGVPDGSTPIPLQGLDWDFNFHLEPVVDELMLEVTSPDYETWRPTAEPGPKPGKPIQFTATVKRASGETAKIEVDHFTWELTETSTEPGIALNYPLLNPNDGEPDLKLDPQPGQLARDEKGQKVERWIPPGVEDSAVVLPYDWGGWSTLQVAAYLRDGRKLVGKYKGSQEEHVRLPKRAKDSYIAESWKKDTGASGADADDNEKEPAGEPGCDGDGLTLYEEYRGFYENGKHIETNPKRKDLLIFNQCGAVAEPGISLFGSLTGLELHKDLLEDERNSLSGDYTAINGNFSKGPHRVLQHRIEITNCGATRNGGAGTRSTNPGHAAGHHMRPKDVENIYVEQPGSSYWSEQYGVSSVDQPRQFDVALAHELLHAVGVEHHGDGDNTRKFEARDASYPDNPTGHAAWLMFGTTPVTFLDETTGADISESTAAKALKLLAKAATGEISAGTISDQDWFVQNLTVGVENGESSGDENCVMRYWLSDVYPKKGVDLTLYLFPAGTEPVGAQLCSSTKGTSINAAGRSPQPRYFDAAANRGNCKSWVCVNDAIPGKPNTIPEKGQ